ncbi:winged helix-turn-helix domain-containing tetratricopeptide repeat protein [Bordetella genomosp. 13]|uniref:winged helix-turn-helix domain-containing tetratricopeptide repeat protein n=1 Tax=Bordetella genomosp. 13 TaxID=463040 RepID=UPI00119DA7F0|nr:winged helix-turn-helix domain-containing tetratricopeptide repeat protein [Bordetella genomosp. 13]
MLLAFDDCVIDLDRRELSRASQVVATPPQVFDLLVYLAQNRERVVSRDDLIAAVWAGRIVSESTLASHINAVRKAVGDSGQQQGVIRTVARKGFRFVAQARETGLQPPDGAAQPDGAPQPATGQAATKAAAPAVLPAKPSIAVLPFVNLSGDPEQEYLADGVVEDVIAALSQYRWMFVVARNSSFTYKARAVDVKQVGRELGVRYVLEGSWRKAGNRVRITGQLIDAATGALHWAGRFEGVLEDIFELQDQITRDVVGAIAPQLERAEIERARHTPTDSMDAYDCYLRGMAWLHQGTRLAIDHALPLFEKAIASDPEFSSAYAMAAWCHCWRKLNGWMTDRPREIAEGLRLARRAIELDNNDAVALTRCGPVAAHLGGDLKGGIALVDRALALNPNLAPAWFLGAYLRLWDGQTDTAIEHFTHAMRQSPLDMELYRMQAGIAAAHLFQGRHDESVAWAEKSLRELPSFLLAAAVLAASQALAGRDMAAANALARLRELDPALRLSNLRDLLPIQKPDDLDTLTRGLRKAGLPA